MIEIEEVKKLQKDNEIVVTLIGYKCTNCGEIYDCYGDAFTCCE